MFVFIIINCVLLAGSFVIGLYAHHTAGEYLASDTLLIISGYNQNTALVEQSSGIITKGDRQAYSTVIFCNSAYFDIYFMHFIEGGQWHDSENYLQVVILSESLAWYLFGGGDIAGMTVEIDGAFFQIIGVVRQGVEYVAWLPNGRRNTTATSMYLHRDYIIPGQSYIDIDRYIESISHRFKILFYIVLLYLLIVFVQKRWWIGLAAGVLILVGVNDLLLWLPSQGVFASLTNIGILTAQHYLSYGLIRIQWLNTLANFAWLVGFVGIFNLIFIGGILKDE